MRKGFNGLSGIVENNLDGELIPDHVYVFITKSRDKIKLLPWAGIGFVLYYMRL